MLVLKTTSPKVSPRAPKARPVETVPSSRASFAGVSAIDPPRPVLSIVKPGSSPEQFAHLAPQGQPGCQQPHNQEAHGEDGQGAGQVVALLGLHEQADDGARDR